MKKKIRALTLCVMLGCSSYGHARPSASTLSVPTFADHGTNRTPFKLLVTSESASSPFDVVRTTTVPFMQRGWILQNPSAYFLMVGTFSTFGISDQWFFVPHSSGTYQTNSTEKFWLRLMPGAKTEWVTGEYLSE